MKSNVRLIALALVVITLTSCGLPGALVRSGGRAVNGVQNLAGGR